jgi:hypothetical protein
MSWTPWKSPRKTQGIESNEIQFVDNNVSSVLTSKTSIKSTANFFGELVTTESTALVFTDFGFELDGQVVESIEIRLKASRLGRTQDKVIGIWDGTKRMGANMANLEATDDFTYSGTLGDWKLSSATKLDYVSPDFGVVIDLQPHTQYPSNVTVYIRKVQVRLKLADPE